MQHFVGPNRLEGLPFNFKEDDKDRKHYYWKANIEIIDTLTKSRYQANIKLYGHKPSVEEAYEQALEFIEGLNVERGRIMHPFQLIKVNHRSHCVPTDKLPIWACPHCNFQGHYIGGDGNAIQCPKCYEITMIRGRL